MYPSFHARTRFNRPLGEAPISAPAPTVAPEPAPSAFAQALQEAGPSEEVAYYVFQTTLNANQAAPNLSQFIDGDSDFVLVSLHGISTGNYNIAISDKTGKPIHSAATDARTAVGTAQLPVRLRPALYYPAAGKIGINLTDTSGAQNTVTLVFTGIKKFRTQG